MEIVNSVILFVLGFYILIKGAQLLVRGAVAIANVFKISTWFVGAVIVSFGTSVPELSVNLAAGFSGSAIGLSAILGSNLFNIFIVLGLSAIFYPIAVHRNWIVYDFTTHIAVSFIAGLFILTSFVGEAGFVGVSRFEGVVLLFLMIVWIVSLWRRKIQHEEEVNIGAVTIVGAIVLFVFGLIGVFVGGKWVIDSATVIAAFLGVSERVIGTTIVALGTSLPEFVVSFSALLKGATGIAVGNVIGSSIMNLLAILGVTAVISPIAIFDPLTVDVFAVYAMSVILLLAMYVGKRYTLARHEGIIFVLLYVIYIGSLFVT